MAKTRIFGIVLAGGEGKRLMPLTTDRAKPAVPFGGGYRLIDFAISNLVNSGLRHIVVLTQYKSHSLDRHISQTWHMSPMLGQYITSVPAQQRLGKRWFTGSADAILQSLNLVRDEQPDLIVVVGADHVYRMDFREMIAAHVDSGLPATVAAVRQPIALADQFGVVLPGSEGSTIAKFLEKPQNPTPLADDPTHVLASMGNYVFNTDALVDAVSADGDRTDSSHDMGGDIIPAFVSRHEAGYYDFSRSTIPGATERDRCYWRDVGTIDSYYEAHMDLIAALPVFNLYNNEWPIYTQQLNLAPAKFVRDAESNVSQVIDSIVSLGVLVVGGTVLNSVLGPRTLIDGGARVDHTITFDSVTIGAGATVSHAILDKFVVVEPGATVGVDRDLDIRRGFTVTDSGITVVEKGTRIAP